MQHKGGLGAAIRKDHVPANTTAACQLQQSKKFNLRIPMPSCVKLPAVLVCALLLSACAQSSGVMQLAPNTYSIVTADEVGGAIAAKRSGLQEAAAFCASRGQQMVTMQTQTDVRPDFVGDPVAHHDLTFRCVAPGTAGHSVVGGSENALIVR